MLLFFNNVTLVILALVNSHKLHLEFILCLFCSNVLVSQKAEG